MSTDPVPRPEHPRPQFARADWHSLNGPWTCRIDPLGSETDGRDADGFDRPIQVPFAPESQLSGIGHTGFIESLWYHRKLHLPEGWAGRRVLLHFGAVDWHARVYLDGGLLAEHWGGSTGFTVDLRTRLQADRSHDLVVHACDSTQGHEQPCGKQSRKAESYGCYYTRTTGIWQPVWLEAVGTAHFRHVAIVPGLETGRFVLTPQIAGAAASVRVDARLDGRPVGRVEAQADSGFPIVLDLAEIAPWSPESPRLYDLDLVLLDDDGAVSDRIAAYAGLRSVAIRGDRFLLNGKERYLRLVLDQGFYPDGIWTASGDDALRRDIELAMAMGFNGARLHQKVFEPRYHYWADRLGFLTWGESASWGFDVDEAAGARNFLPEWAEAIEQCGNHPSIIAWTPLNESGHRLGRGNVPVSEMHRRLVRDAAALTRRIDPSRPVNDSSGWVHQDTDIWTSHSYEQDPETLKSLLTPPPDVFRNAPASEPTYAGQPYMIDEFGGAAWTGQVAEVESRQTAGLRRDNEFTGTWGYGEAPGSVEEFEARISDQVAALLALPFVKGYCYTQLTDVEQEQNGLLTYNREPKLPLERYRAIFGPEPRTPS